MRKIFTKRDRVFVRFFDTFKNTNNFNDKLTMNKKI